MNLKEKINSGEATVCVVGLGWMGLPIAAVFLDAGAKVYGLDINSKLIDKLKKLDINRKEDGLKDSLTKHKDNFFPTTDYAEAVSNSDVIIVIVPLLIKEDKRSDYSIIQDVINNVAKHLKNDAVIIFSTTMPIGSMRSIVKPILDNANKEYSLVYAPIRARTKTAIVDMRKTHPRIIAGITSKDVSKGKEVLESFMQNDIIVMDKIEEAEAVKLFEVIYRDVNIALANELGLICEDFDLDYNKIKEATNTCMYYNLHDCGIGVGGHCLPVYPYLLLNMTNKDTGLIRKARDINDFMPLHVANIVDSLKPSTVTVYGLSYLRNTSETRWSPGIDFAKELKKRGYTVKICDPNLTNEELSLYGEPVSLEDGLTSDLLAFTVNHKEFIGIESRIPESAIVVDGRNFLNRELIKGRYIVIGDGNTTKEALK